MQSAFAKEWSGLMRWVKWDGAALAEDGAEYLVLTDGGGIHLAVADVDESEKVSFHVEDGEEVLPAWICDVADIPRPSESE